MRIFWIMLMAISFLFGAIPQNVINKVKENPALLDTPQGKAMLNQYGLTKEEVLALIKQKNDENSTTSIEPIKQNIINYKTNVPQNILDQIKENPAILDTPQGKAILNKYGLTKEEMLDLIKNKNNFMIPQNILDQIENNPDILDTPVGKILLKEYNLTKDDLLSFINKTKQTKIKEPSPFKFLKEDQIVSKTKELRQKLLVEKGLKHFGFNFFSNANSFNPLAMPTPDYYILTPGDTLSVQLFGSKNDSYDFTIDNNGNIMIPIIGPVKVGGEEFGKVKKDLALTMQKAFPNSKAVVNMKKFSTIQVILTGEAKAPGIYNLPSLSTVQTLLVYAKGVLPTGSLRDIEVYRDGKLISRVDLYKLLMNHPPKRYTLLRSGDIVHISKAKKEVMIYGEIKKPAIYELKENENAKTLLKFAGPLTPRASKSDIVVKRYDEHKTLKDIVLTLKEFKNFKLKDGDEIVIYPLDSLKKDNVYLFGNVIKPGPIALTKETHSLHNLFKKLAPNSLEEIFLPDTYLNYGYIKRELPNMQEKIISFNPLNVYNKKEDLTPAQVTANAKLVQYLKTKYPTIEYLIGHYEYEKMQKTGMWLEKDKNYRTKKSDPGKKFMKAVRKKVAILGLKSSDE